MNYQYHYFNKVKEQPTITAPKGYSDLFTDYFLSENPIAIFPTTLILTITG